MSIEIWPNIQKVKLTFKRVNHLVLEDTLSNMFDGAYPVVCSSGRSSISLILEHLRLTRGDFVKVPAYASHCVLESVSRFATPLSYKESSEVQASIIYHQWGNSKSNVYPNSGIIIEDACDSVYIERKIKFPLGGKFEIWSLPKILACNSGGVIWCKNENDADEIASLRDKRSHAKNLQWFLRLLGKKYDVAMNYWSSTESLSGKLSKFPLNEILSSLSRYDEIAERRKERLNLVASYLGKGKNISMDYRLPCCLPMEVLAQEIEKINSKGINIGFKNFEIINENGKTRIVKVFPLPVHDSIPMDMLESCLELIKTKNVVV
jgi:putative PLP-dependent aminotransferase (TIGR04422 family)